MASPVPKRVAVVGALLLGLLLVAVVVQRTALVAPAPKALQSESAAPPQPAATHGHAPLAVVREVHGVVEAQHSGGGWRTLRSGERLNVDDVVRTAAGARASLQLGKNVRVDVAEATTLSIQQVSATLSKVTLNDGRLMSKVEADGDFRFRVEIRKSNAVAETAFGEFGVLQRGSSAAALAAKSGDVELRGKHGSVRIGAGEMSHVSATTAPAVPSKIPSSLYLKFSPTPRVGRMKSIALEGTTAPGASVTVDGKRAAVDASGKFRQQVALKQGENEILVVVEDALGRTTSASPRITVRAGPKVEGVVQW
jgi:hypothetical protein